MCFTVGKSGLDRKIKIVNLIRAVGRQRVKNKCVENCEKGKQTMPTIASQRANRTAIRGKIMSGSAGEQGSNVDFDD